MEGEKYILIEKEELKFSTMKKLIEDFKSHVSQEDALKLKKVIKLSLTSGTYQTNKADEKVEVIINTLFILMNEMGLRDASLIATVLLHPLKGNVISIEYVEREFGKDIANVLTGLLKVEGLTASLESIASDNYVKLLITLAEDLRVVLIRIGRALHMMRCITEFDSRMQLKLALKAKHVYAPLAHKLGLYKVKLEMDDLYLLYTDKEAYDFIVKKLKDSQDIRNKFIKDFIKPIEDKLKNTALKYDIKGRTKSISSIDNKLKKQKIEFESIYDIFAIRLILDSPAEQEKADCWQAYSIVTDLYTPNPKRLKDWLSIPKSNGYESLHTTVMSPEHKWVEVQIRSKRMDDIAERGLAAHWKYKGLKSQSKVDDWLTNLREVLENQNMNSSEKLEDFKLDLYDEEIYVFTPKGDLHRLPHDATVLDFAFSIHSKIGCTCVSGKVNGRNVSIKQQLKNGDQVAVVTAANQKPKRDWLQFVHTSKAKNKIRQSLKEEASKQVEIAKELLQRRFKNRKIELDESILMKAIKKLGFKHLTDFHVQIAEDKLDINQFIDLYLQLDKKENENPDALNVTSAGNYVITPAKESESASFKDELVLDKNLTGIDYTLAKCCNPIFGDEVFAFVSNKGIKIHRKNCPNAQDMFTRFNYRILPARWNGASGADYTVTLKIVGSDDISIVNNITSIISKETGVGIRAISIDSNDGVFHGNLSVKLTDKDKLNQLIRKLQNIKGVKSVTRQS